MGIAQDDLNNFLAVAEDLKIKGLTQGNSDSDRSKQSSVKDHQRSSYKKPVKSAPATAVSQSMDDDDIQEVETVPIKQELDTVKTPAAEYSQYQSNQQVATGEEFDDGQYYEEYDDTYTDDYSGAGQLVGDKGLFVDVVHEELESFLDQNCVKEGINWVCQFCGKASINVRDIKRHIEAKHVSMPPMPCGFCGKQYKNRDSLRKHKQRDHKHY